MHTQYISDVHPSRWKDELLCHLRGERIFDMVFERTQAICLPILRGRSGWGSSCCSLRLAVVYETLVSAFSRSIMNAVVSLQALVVNTGQEIGTYVK